MGSKESGSVLDESADLGKEGGTLSLPEVLASSSAREVVKGLSVMNILFDVILLWAIKRSLE